VRVTWQSERTGIENKWLAPTGRVVAVQVEADGDLDIAVGNATDHKRRKAWLRSAQAVTRKTMINSSARERRVTLFV
jgi:hypothetical protein